MRLTEDEFAAIVEEALAEIPAAMSDFMDNIIVDVEPMPSRHDLNEVGIDDPTELLGLYHGTPITERGDDGVIPMPDRITIYQRNLEAVCESRKELIEQIRTTVFHEVGHHFGLDEDDLEELGYE